MSASRDPGEPAFVLVSPQVEGAGTGWHRSSTARARRPDQNRHRLADGWQGSTVRAILENPRYTGYAVFGRWAKHETLLDPDDGGAGHVIRVRRANPHRVVRSRQPAHPAIVSVEDFVQVQVLRRSRAAGGLSASRKLERGRGRRSGRTHCAGGFGAGTARVAWKERRAPTAPITRGAARSLVPGSPAMQGHPKNV